MQNGIELVRKPGQKVVADPLRFRPIDHSDSPLQARLSEVVSAVSCLTESVSRKAGASVSWKRAS